MNKPVASLSVLLLVGLIACATKTAPTKATESGVSGSTGTGSLNRSTPASSGTDDDDDDSAGLDGGGGGDGGHHHKDGGAESDGGASVVTPQTCDSLATAAPAGTLNVTTVHGITPVDIYATQDADSLTIVLTTTAAECGYRGNNLLHSNVTELQLSTPTPAGGFAPGTFQPTDLVLQSTTDACGGDDDDDDGTFKEDTLQGTLTITAINAGSVTGTMDVFDSRGHEDSFTFTAPICPELTDAQIETATCCAQ